MVDEIGMIGWNASIAALSWLGPRHETHADGLIDAAFSAALEGDFDISADGVYLAESRRVRVRKIVWFCSSTPDIEALDDETVTFRMGPGHRGIHCAFRLS